MAGPNLVIYFNASGNPETVMKYAAAHSLKTPDRLLAWPVCNVFARNGMVVRMPTARYTLFAMALIAHPGRCVTKEEAFLIIFGEDPEGGPIYGVEMLIGLWKQLKPMLISLGFRAETVWSTGYRVWPMFKGETQPERNGEAIFEALKPFATAAVEAGIAVDDETFDNKFSHVKDLSLMRGHFRRARKAVEEHEQ